MTAPVRYQRLADPPVTAVRWFPGVAAAGVSGTDPGKLCGCVLVGSDLASTPHVHRTDRDPSAYPLDPGDWVVTWAGGERTVMTDPTFSQEFAPVPPDPALPAAAPQPQAQVLGATTLVIYRVLVRDMVVYACVDDATGFPGGLYTSASRETVADLSTALAALAWAGVRDHRAAAGKPTPGPAGSAVPA